MAIIILQGSCLKTKAHHVKGLKILVTSWNAGNKHRHHELDYCDERLPLNLNLFTWDMTGNEGEPF